MSAEKRSVHTDALATLGTVIDNTQKRDAIHLAVEPSIAGEQLYPGQHIGIVDGKAITTAAKKLGIVDPFITGFVPEGSHFWLIVYPRQITSLRHVWEHPDFGENINPKVDSEKWLRNFCANSDCPSYETVVGAVKDNGGDFDEYFHFDGIDAHAAIPAEFWDHMETIVGFKITSRPEYFSCSC